MLSIVSPCCEFLVEHFACRRRGRGGIGLGGPETAAAAASGVDDEIDLSLHRVLRLQPAISIGWLAEFLHVQYNGKMPCVDILKKIK